MKLSNPRPVINQLTITVVGGLRQGTGPSHTGTPGPPNLDCSVFLGSDTIFFGGQRLFFIMP